MWKAARFVSQQILRPHALLLKGLETTTVKWTTVVLAYVFRAIKVNIKGVW